MSILGNLVLPSGIAYALIVLGLLAMAWPRLRRYSCGLLAAAGVIVLVFSSGKTAAALMSPLEYTYPTVHQPQQFPQARHIVVLTGWAADDPTMPLSGRLNASSTYRVLMALELYHDRPDCDVIVSGDPVTAKIMGEVMVKLGVPAEKLRLEEASLTTGASAANLKPILGKDEFFLVTSAGHLPRSMAALQRQQLTAIPVPTDHQMPRDWTLADLHPVPGSLTVSDLAVHEYIGRLWYRLNGRS